MVPVALKGAIVVVIWAITIIVIVGLSSGNEGLLGDAEREFDLDFLAGSYISIASSVIIGSIGG